MVAVDERAHLLLIDIGEIGKTEIVAEDSRVKMFKKTKRGLLHERQCNLSVGQPSNWMASSRMRRTALPGRAYWMPRTTIKLLGRSTRICVTSRSR